MKVNLSVVLASALLTACATKIHARNETITPSKERFGAFGNVVMRPLTVDRSEGDDDARAANRIDERLRQCMKDVFAGLKDVSSSPQASSDARTLLIEPSITDMKKVNSAERFFMGAMRGSSAVLLKIKFTDAGANDILAEPIFYARGDAGLGSLTIGATDNRMLTHIVNSACDYSRQNY